MKDKKIRGGEKVLVVAIRGKPQRKKNLKCNKEDLKMRGEFKAKPVDDTKCRIYTNTFITALYI